MDKFFKAFPALKSRNYQLYFIGQTLSLIGTWLQIVAQGWLVLQLTGSPYWLGVITAIGSLPILIFSLLGGVIVDRFRTKHIIIFTQTCLMILAFALGLLTLFHRANLFNIALNAFLAGVITAIDMPARQAFVVEMVGREKMSSAIALNSGIFNAARVVGPAIAGILIALIGTAGAFLVNGVSFMAVIIALFFIHAPGVINAIHPHPLKAIKDGLSYSFTHPLIRVLLLFAAVSSIFGWSYTAILPYIVQYIFHENAAGLGYFYMVGGMGALIGAVVTSAFANKTNAFKFIFVGNLFFSLSLILFSFVNKSIYAYPFLFLSGFGLIIQFSTINSTIQHLVSDSLRGRVMSIYTLMFVGMTPVGSFLIGYLAEHWGAPFAVRLNASIIFIFGLLLFSYRKRFKSD